MRTRQTHRRHVRSAGGSAASRATVWSVLLGLLLSCVLPACGAEGTPAPVSGGLRLNCPTLDERIPIFTELVLNGELASLEVIVDRLGTERDGARLEQSLVLLLGILQALPADEARAFDFQIINDLIDDLRDLLVIVLDFLREGPEERLHVVYGLRGALTDCPRDSLILTLQDVLGATDLVAALGATLEDDEVVSLLTSIPDLPEDGRDGFIALIGTVLNAIQSPNFDIEQLRGLLGFLELDEPPLSGLLDATEAYLQGDRLDHLLTTLSCFEQLEYNGISEVDLIGGLLYDLLTLEGLDIGSLLSLAAPLLEQIQSEEIQTLGAAIMDTLVDDLALREIAIDLIVFLLREDNVPPLLDVVAVLLETGALDELINAIDGIIKRCPANHE